MDNNNNNNQTNPQDYSNQQYQQPYQQPNQQPNFYNNGYNGYQPPAPDNNAKNLAIASLVLGIVSFFCFGLPCSIISIVLGSMSKKKQPENNGMATAGIVLSIIALALWALGIFSWLL